MANWWEWESEEEKRQRQADDFKQLSSKITQKADADLLGKTANNILGNLYGAAERGLNLLDEQRQQAQQAAEQFGSYAQDRLRDLPNPLDVPEEDKGLSRKMYDAVGGYALDQGSKLLEANKLGWQRFGNAVTGGMIPMTEEEKRRGTEVSMDVIENNPLSPLPFAQTPEVRGLAPFQEEALRRVGSAPKVASEGAEQAGRMADDAARAGPSTVGKALDMLGLGKNADDVARNAPARMPDVPEVAPRPDASWNAADVVGQRVRAPQMEAKAEDSTVTRALRAIGLDAPTTRAQADGAGRTMASGGDAMKRPWEMAKDEYINFDFDGPSSGSWTPKEAARVRADGLGGQYETLRDVATKNDRYQLNEVIGVGYEDNFGPASTHIIGAAQKDAPITVYRTSDIGDILPGAFVTESKQYALDHAAANIHGSKAKLYTKKVKPSELVTFGDPHEFIWVPQSIEREHEKAVRFAAFEGKNVPVEVLAEYPDLARQLLEEDQYWKPSKAIAVRARKALALIDNGGTSGGTPGGVASGIISRAQSGDAAAGQFDRYYHGTGGAFDRPDPDKFDPDGLFGPGYYVTSDARVAGSYAVDKAGAASGASGITIDGFVFHNADDVTPYIEARAARLEQMRESGANAYEVQQLERNVNALKWARQKLEGVTDGPNIRPVDIPNDLNIFHVMDESDPVRFIQSANRSLGVRQRREFAGALGRATPTESENYRNVDLWDALQFASSKEKANAILRRMGYDGVEYPGGKGIPIYDDAGNPIEHRVLVIFPESLDKIRNATAGTPGGMMPPTPPKGSTRAIDEGMGKVAKGLVQGGVAGGYEASQEEGATPQSIAEGALKGAALGVGNRLLKDRLPGFRNVELRAAARAVADQSDEPGKTWAFGVNDANQRYDFRYRVVDLKDLIASHLPDFKPNPQFPKELQPRLRDRAAAEAQVREIAAKLNPEALLTDTRSIQSGPPIIGADNIIESGNGRVMAIRRAMRENPAAIEQYRETLLQRIDELGIDPAETRGKTMPVLVRERLTDVDRAAFAKEANESTVAAMSGFEKALSDARVLSDDLIAGLSVNENQTIDQALSAAGNRDIIRAFVQALPQNERGTMADASGNLSAEGLQRFKNALLAKAYGSDAGQRMARSFVESIDPGVRNVESAVFGSLPRVARAEAVARGGDLALADDIATAVDVYARLKQQGYAVQDYLSQLSMFERETTPAQDALLEMFEANKRSARAIREVLEGYGQRAEQYANQNQASLFGDALPAVSKEDLLVSAIRESAGEESAQAASTAIAAAHTGLDGGAAKPALPPIGNGGVLPSGQTILPPSATPQPVRRGSGVGSLPQGVQASSAAQGALPGNVAIPPAGGVPPVPPNVAIPLPGLGTAQRRGPMITTARGIGPNAVAVANAITPPPTAGQTISRLPVEAIRALFDNTVALRQFSEMVGQRRGAPLHVAEDAWKLLRLSRGSGAMADEWLETGMRPVVHNLDDRGRDLLNLYLKSHDTIDKAQAVNNPLRNFGGMTAHEAQLALQEMQQRLSPSEWADIERRGQAAWDYGQWLLDQKVAHGLVDASDAQMLKQTFPHYNPIFIVDWLEDAAARNVGASGSPNRLSVGSNLVRRLTEEGTSRAAEAPLDALVRSSYETARVTSRNDAVQAFVQYFVQDPGLQSLITPADTRSRMFLGAASPPVGRRGPQEQVITAWVNGEALRYYVSPEIAHAINFQTPNLANNFLANIFLRIPAEVLRAGATGLNMLFIPVNAVGDAFTYLVRNGGIANPDAWRNLGAGYAGAIRKDADYRLMQSLGAGQAGFFTGQTKAAHKRVLELADERALSAWVRDVFAPIRAAGATVESATRLAEFKGQTRRGVDPREAALAARDVTVDFQRGGWLTKYLNTAIPFFNVAFQAPAQIARLASSKDPNVRNRAMVGFMSSVIAPAVVGELYNRQFPEYADVPQWDKDRGFIVMDPRGAGPVNPETGRPTPRYVIIPAREWAPFVIGVREAMTAAFGDDQREWTDALHAIVKSASPIEPGKNVVFDVMPTLPKVGIELAVNYDSFRDRPIVPDALKRLPNEQQYTSETTQTARALGKLTGQSPMLIQHGITGLGAGVGRQALAAGDMALQAAGVTPEPSRRVAQLTRELAKTGLSDEKRSQLQRELDVETAREQARKSSVKATPIIGGLASTVYREQGGEIERRTGKQIDERLKQLRSKDDPMGAELSRLGVTFSDVDNQIGGQTLNRYQTAEYRSSAMAYRETMLQQLLASSVYRDADDATKTRLVRNAMNRAAAWASQDVLPRPSEAGAEFRTMANGDITTATQGYLRALEAKQQIDGLKSTRYIGYQGEDADEISQDRSVLSALRQGLGQAQGDAAFLARYGARRYARAKTARVNPMYRIQVERIERSTPEYQAYLQPSVTRAIAGEELPISA